MIKKNKKMNENMKSILWQCRRVFRWSWHAKRISYHSKYYRVRDGIIDKNYVGLHTIDKIPFDLSNNKKTYYDFMCPICPTVFKPIRISTEMLVSMHETELEQRDQKSHGGTGMMPCLEYGDSQVFIYILASAMDKVWLEDASKFLGNNKKRKRKTQGSQKRIKEAAPYLKKFKNRSRGLDDIVPAEVLVPAMILPFGKPPGVLERRRERDYFLTQTHSVLHPKCETVQKCIKLYARDFSAHFFTTWVGWHEDYNKPGPWPYFLWKGDSVPRPMHAKVIRLMMEPTGNYRFLKTLQPGTKNFQPTSFCEAVKEAEFNVDFKMMKKFGLTKEVQRGRNTWEAPFLISEMLVNAVVAYTTEQKKIEIYENSRESSPGVSVNWSDLLDIINSSSSSSSTASKKHPKSHVEEEEEKDETTTADIYSEEEKIELVAALISNRGESNSDDDDDDDDYDDDDGDDDLQLWNKNWAERRACAELVSIPLPDQLKHLNTDQIYGEKLLDDRKTRVKKMENDLRHANTDVQQIELGLSRIKQEKECYGQRRQLETIKKNKENFKKWFAEKVDTMPDEVVLSEAASNKGWWWINKHFENFVFFVSSSPSPPQPQAPVVIPSPVIIVGQSVLREGSHTFLSEIPSPDMATLAIGSLTSKD